MNSTPLRVHTFSVDFISDHTTLCHNRRARTDPYPTASKSVFGGYETERYLVLTQVCDFITERMDLKQHLPFSILTSTMVSIENLGS